jgi:hypothetical protein
VQFDRGLADFDAFHPVSPKRAAAKRSQTLSGNLLPDASARFGLLRIEQFFVILRRCIACAATTRSSSSWGRITAAKALQGDPTHVRAITAFAENGWPNTPLAEFLDVDFGVARIIYHLTGHRRQQSVDGMPAAELLHAVTTYNNVVEQVTFELRVVKSPATQEKPGRTDGNFRCELR